MFPFTDTAPRAALPLLVFGLIAVNTLVFLWMWDMPPREQNGILVHYALIPIRYTNPAVAVRLGLDPANWWPLLTNTFLHGGWLHLISNMWFLWIFGPAMEGRLGRLLFLILYLGGGVAASTVHVWTHADSTEPVLGASGAIAAVIAAHAMTFPRERVVMVVLLIIIPLFFSVPTVAFALIWFALQIIQGTSELASHGMASSVAWWAHIGGFGFGALFAWVVGAFEFDSGVRTTAWSGRGRHVPLIKPRTWM